MVYTQSKYKEDKHASTASRNVKSPGHRADQQTVDTIPFHLEDMQALDYFASGALVPSTPATETRQKTLNSCWLSSFNSTTICNAAAVDPNLLSLKEYLFKFAMKT